MVTKLDETRAKQVFELFDKDGDGKISQDELKDILMTIGQNPTDAELREMIGGSVSGLFTARGGAIDFKTFQEILVRARPHTTKSAPPSAPRAILPPTPPPKRASSLSLFFSLFLTPHISLSLSLSSLAVGRDQGA